ncbi:hypothetical protein [Aliiglaciecola sp. M165]|uniref:hypothetical protein n=1 Tax=Aliiglaciecola sp. M165 TaxID=2593649 RepID=UPI0011815BB2|nr:hypothetical protein [Aliiglaciecola sp. M165]TRY30377.1 hypothetical protein FM019_16340 [Aliiglaciecola sp. M165]
MAGNVLKIRPLYLPLAYVLTLWLFNYSLGFISIEQDRTSVLARDAGAAVVLPLLTALLWWSRNVCIVSCANSLGYIASHRRTRKQSKLVHHFEKIIINRLSKLNAVIAVLAAMIATLYLSSEGLFNVQETSVYQVSEYRYLLLLQALPLWFCLLSYITTLYFILRLVFLYCSKYMRVRLFEVEEMSPICDLIVVNFLFATLLISTYPINSFFVDIPKTDQFLMLFFAIIIAGILLVPIYWVQSVIRLRKDRSLTRVNDSLNAQLDKNHTQSAQRRLVDDDVRLQYISDLLVVRKEIQRAPVWPMNVPFALKMLFILTIPLLSWTGAGIISQMIKPWTQ